MGAPIWTATSATSYLVLFQVICSSQARRYTEGVKMQPLLLTTLLAGCLANPFPTAPEQRPPAPGTDLAWTEGHKLYDAACARCHGADGGGVPGQGVSLRGLRATDRQLQAHVRTGKLGHMPARGGYPMMTDEQVRLIVEHLRTLAP